MNKKKRLISLLLGWSLIFLAVPIIGFAQPLGGFDSGIENQREYQELVFLTGTPVLMKGTVKTSIKTTNKKGIETKKESFKYDLKQVGGGDKAGKLTRSLTISSTLDKTGTQLTEDSFIEKFDESVTVGGKTYKADRKDKVASAKPGTYSWDSAGKSSEFTRSAIYDRKPAIDYYAGNFAYRKVYKAQDANEPSILVDMEGVSVGYDSNWGSTETRTMTYYVSSQDPKGVQGTYTVKTSNNITKDIEYMENQPTLISFRGGYMISEKDESVLEYTFDLNGFTGSGSYTLANNPHFQRLYVPIFADVKGHWAQEAIDIIASMQAFEVKGKNFGPSLPVSREEFAKAVAILSEITDETEQTIRKNKKEQEAVLYKDVSPQSQDYKYVKAASVKGLVAGVGDYKFEPKSELTNAQAAQMLISALGYEALAPGGNYSTGYADDASLPYWGKDAIYMAKEIGLMTGTDNGYFQPNKTLTRAQAAILLQDYINYMSEDLREDFRERIMNY